MTLFAIESQGELMAIECGLSSSKGLAEAPTTHPRKTRTRTALRNV
jgi:hypothetical protein